MNLAAIRAIVRRDLTVVARSRAVSIPLVVLPLIMFVLLPAALVLGADALVADPGEYAELLALMPPELLADLGDVEGPALIAVWGLEYAFASLFLIVPLMTSAVIAADSFAGEKERKTLEALVYTPTTDMELYAGKLAGPWAASVAIGLVGFVAFALVANVLAAPLVGRPVVLTLRWALTILWLLPAVSALAVGALVIVSARVRGFQEAYQMGSLVVLPLVLLVVGQLAGVLYLGPLVMAIIGLVVWVVAAALLAAGYRGFRRERLLLQL